MLCVHFSKEGFDVKLAPLAGIKLLYPDFDFGTQPRQRIETVEYLAAKLFLRRIWQRRGLAECQFECLDHTPILPYSPEGLNPYPS